MNLVENFSMAIDSIRANKMRSFLTMLGIIIGISSVIMIIALGNGGKNNITGEFEKIGTNNVSIMVDTNKATQSDAITDNDIEAIKTKIDTVKYITPNVSATGKVSTEKEKIDASIAGGNEDYNSIQNTTIVSGRFFNGNDVLNSKAVGLIDEDGAKAIFGNTDVIGKGIKVEVNGNTKNITIIGITESQKSPGAGMRKDKRASIIAPYTLVQQMNPLLSKIYAVTISATDKENVDSATNTTVNMLENRHNNPGKDIYTAQSMMNILSQINSVLGIFTTFVAAVAAISLLVGGIGVMNIMLVSVTERTREIGIRKAIGATTKTILIQFLTESIIVASIGGIIGLTLGYVGAQIAGLIAGITPSISALTVILVILFSSSIGIFFGIYPARKAASLNPIDALRYE